MGQNSTVTFWITSFWAPSVTPAFYCSQPIVFHGYVHFTTIGECVLFPGRMVWITLGDSSATKRCVLVLKSWNKIGSQYVFGANAYFPKSEWVVNSNIERVEHYRKGSQGRANWYWRLKALTEAVCGSYLLKPHFIITYSNPPTYHCKACNAHPTLRIY